MHKKSLLTIVGTLVQSSLAWHNGLGLTPPMGWISPFGINQTEDNIKLAVAQMQQVRLDKVGYKYVVLGEGWQGAQREADGTLHIDKTRFPAGMDALIENITAAGY